jgi:GNAT superfamily N-acetyltransferase
MISQRVRSTKENRRSFIEMKRMFVYPEFHGKGIGYALAKAIIDEAKKIGYSSMKLDTSIRQIEAQNLYQGFGFKNIEAY